jgi:hypothetical protein
LESNALQWSANLRLASTAEIEDFCGRFCAEWCGVRRQAHPTPEAQKGGNQM